MNTDQKTVVLGLTLAGSLAALWYFSQGKNAVAVQSINASDSNQSPPNVASNGFTFNLPPLSVPPITIPDLGNSAGSSGSCCRNCGGTYGTSNGPSPGSLVPSNVASNTVSAKPAPATQPSVDHAYIYEPWLEGNDGALPRPNPVLWTQDKIYRLAYVLSWNDNVKNANDMCWRSGSGGTSGGYVCKIGPLDVGLANNPDVTAIESATYGTASAILKSSPGDPLYTAMMQSMSVYMNQFGDKTTN